MTLHVSASSVSSGIVIILNRAARQLDRLPGAKIDEWRSRKP
jgi:hypothetical protein